MRGGDTARDGTGRDAAAPRTADRDDFEEARSPSAHRRHASEHRRRETTKTVLAAGAANLFIAVVKAIAGAVSGSSAMLAESAHSVADTLNQVFLLTSLRRSTRPADPGHPFGYGQERYFWSLLAAVGIFVAGGGFSIFEGVLAIMGHGGDGSPTLAYVVLAVAFVAEGASWLRAVQQLRREARQDERDLLDHVGRTRDMTVKAALFEDTAAMIGLVLAAVGLVLRQITGTEFYDGAASVAIGLLLVVVAVRLGYDNMSMLIGRAVDPDLRARIERVIASGAGVDRVEQLLTMYFGPDEILVAAKVSFLDGISADQAEDYATDIDRALQEEIPVVRHVFLDPTERASLS